jgi:hypothetical protein
MTKPDRQNTHHATTTSLSAGTTNLLQLVAAVCILVATAGSACADQRGVFPPDMPQSYRVECDGCHVPFAPDLLPADTWRQIMRGLERHYGVDATFDATQYEEIEKFLVRNAGQGSGLRTRRNGDYLRLTDTLWFHRRHGRVKALFQDPLVGSKANCAACHVQSEEGLYGEYTPLVHKFIEKNKYLNQVAIDPAR